MALDLNALIKSFENCPCGRSHQVDIRGIEIESGLLDKVGEALDRYAFPDSVLLVADSNTLRAADGIVEKVRASGRRVKTELFGDLRVADIRDVERLEALCADVDGILSVGTGSLNDICRLAAYRRKKEFAIFATAPSMDGFASDSAPITTGNFKLSHQAKQPSVILADTRILAASPAYLKSAGFGDMIAKYVGLVDWEVARLTTGEYYCGKIAAMTRDAADKVVSLADKVTEPNEETAAEIMSALVMTGVGMKFAASSRPASGTEHILSHFWEIKKLEEGLISDFHGKKVGVATLLVTRIYHALAQIEEVRPVKECPDRKAIRAAYGENLYPEVEKFNMPPITEAVDPQTLAQSWGAIRETIRRELPPYDRMLALMRQAGCATTTEEISVSDTLLRQGLIYHPYMRRRITLMRLLPMLGLNVIKLTK